MPLNNHAEATTPATPSGSPREVLWTALKLGLTSFGGPIAHLGYYNRTYVRERRWLSEEQYGNLVSLCQFLPGPTSSQVGFLVGVHRAGWLGGIAAWVGFTLPSALLMYLFAVLAPSDPGPRMQAILHGLMLAALVVVAQAVWSMAQSLTPDWPRRAIAAAACLPLLLVHSGLAQWMVLVGGAVAGIFLIRPISHAQPGVARRMDSAVARVALGWFALLLAGLSVGALLQPHGSVALANIFFRSGAFVFGGGHVVLPLLQQALVPAGWLSDDRFLAGYGLAQAMPGPLFTLSAYLGAACAPTHWSSLWALLALVAIFLPGLLLAVAGQALLGGIGNNKYLSTALGGINAAVVGLLAAALYNPVFVSAVHSIADVGTALVAFVLLQRFMAPPILIALTCVAGSLAQSLWG